MDQRELASARDMISKATSVVVISHIRPDGDAVGSVLGLGLALENAGKSVQMVLSDGVPKNFHFLHGVEKIGKTWSDPVDLSIIVDCSDQARIGDALPSGMVPDINIDHHVTNLNFANINLVDSKSAATAEVLVNCFPQLGLKLEENVNEALLTGIITDTIGFRTTSVHGGTLRVAADLVDAGADINYLYREVLSKQSFNALRYWGAGLTSLQYGEKLVWATLTLEDRKVAGYSGRDDADLTTVLSSVNEAEIAVIFIEQTGGTVKISWRARNGYDVSAVAMQFGGGGHRAAAGAEVSGGLNEVKDSVLKATYKILQFEDD